MAELVNKGTLVDLPIFDSVPVVDKQHDVPRIFEMVRLTCKTLMHSEPPYKLQYHGGVIGRNKTGSEIYFTPETMVRVDGIFAYPDTKKVQIDTIESYVIPDENAYRELHL